MLPEKYYSKIYSCHREINQDTTHERYVNKNWSHINMDLNLKIIVIVVQFSNKISILNNYWKGIFISSNTLPTRCENSTHGKRPCCWERLRAGGEEGDRGWDGLMASLIQWRWTWANSGRWWRTGRPGMLQPMGSAKSRIRLSEWPTITTRY